jgi:hypothetical protein
MNNMPDSHTRRRIIKMPNPTRTPTTKPEAALSPEMIQEQIRHLAYELYEQRGREDGHDLDDWLKSELEVNERARVVAA